MGALDHQLEFPGAPGEPLNMQVVCQGKVLRFVLSVEAMPKGLWRGDIRDALSEEVAFMESKLKSPVTVKAVPAGVPSPSAIVGSVTAEDAALAVQEWSHAVLRALRNLSMAHGLPMPRLVATRETAA